MKFKICIPQRIAKLLFKQKSLNKIRCCLTVHIQIWLFLNQKIKHFNDFQNQNSSVLWLWQTRIIEIKQIFQWDIFKSDVTSFFIKKIKKIKRLNDFQNRNFSVLWLKWNKEWRWKKIRYFFMDHIWIWYHFPLVTKY